MLLITHDEVEKPNIREEVSSLWEEVFKDTERCPIDIHTPLWLWSRGGFKVINIEEALKRIEELEKENAKLREELEYYRNRKLSGRQKHNAKWMAIYNDFVVGYESGMTMVEIAKRNNVSERTIYRYKAYYDKLREKEE